jgi:hypothetical protein
MEKRIIFFYGNHNQKAQFILKMGKYAQLGLNHFVLKRLAWTLPEPHISTSENLHAKQKPFFSAILRSEISIFDFLLPDWKLWHFRAIVFVLDFLV